MAMLTIVIQIQDSETVARKEISIQYMSDTCNKQHLYTQDN